MNNEKLNGLRERLAAEELDGIWISNPGEHQLPGQDFYPIRMNGSSRCW